jgi:hypothetical protein
MLRYEFSRRNFEFFLYYGGDRLDNWARRLLENLFLLKDFS